MTRNEVIIRLKRIIKKADEYGDLENLYEIFIFGSFARGSKDPHDCDILLVFESDKDLIYTKEEKTLRLRFGGRISKVDMLICSTHDYNEHYSFIFKKESLIKIWEKDKKLDWVNIIHNLGNTETERDYEKPIQAKLFRMYPSTLKKIEYAYCKKLIQIEEIKSSEYLNLKEKWIWEQYSWDEDGNETIEEFDEFECFTEYLTELKRKKICDEYIRTIKLMYIYAYKNNYFFSEYYNERVKIINEYETHFYTEDKKVLFIIYNPNFEMVFFHFKNQKQLRKIIIIPWVRVRSKENFIYEIKRGSNWRKTYLEKLENIY